MTALERDIHPAYAAYERADKAIAHYQRLLAGAGLTEADQLFARERIVRAMGKRVRAEREMDQFALEKDVAA